MFRDPIMLQIHRVRHMLYFKASGERKQMGQQENEIGYDKKRVERGQVLSVVAQQ